MSSLDRRQFLKDTSRTVTVAAASVTAALNLDQVAKADASERLRIGRVGVGGRASYLLSTFAGLKEVEVVAIADLDSGRLPKAADVVEKLQGKKPRTETDFRKLVDDPKIDAFVVGTPDHWHAIPTILACQAGKDVYVEKPDGHNMVEGQPMVQAMRKHKRIVQMGTQARSSPHFLSAIE